MSTTVNKKKHPPQIRQIILILWQCSKSVHRCLGPGRYSQWHSRFLRYLDTKSNGEYLRKCIFDGPYMPTKRYSWASSLEQHREHSTSCCKWKECKRQYTHEQQRNKLSISEKESYFSDSDWLQQGESLNVQDVKTNLFWEFGKFTSRDGESMESYYSRFYKLLNELTRNNLQVSPMQVNVQFLQQLQPEWSRFVTANPICIFLLAVQPYSDNYYQEPKPQKSNAPSYKQSSSTRSSATTRHKGKEIAKPDTPESESGSEEDSDPEQARRDKDMQKKENWHYLNKTEDTTPRYNNDNQSGQFGNQRTMTVAGARETVGSPVVQKTGIQCFNCKGFGHYARECRKPKRVKDYAYHKEKMLMCKQAEQGVPLQAEQADWLEDTDEEIDEQELEAHYSYMAKIQEVSPEESSSTSQPLEQVTKPMMKLMVFANVDQNAAESVDERAALANLIANLTLDTEENKTILKQLKKANASLTQELKECKTNLDEASRALGEATSSRDSSLIALQTKQTELEKYTALNDLTSDYKILQTKLNDTLGLLARKDIDTQKGLKTKTSEISVVNQKHDELVKKSLLNRSQFEGQLKEKTKVISDLKVKEGRDIDTMIEMEKQIKFLNEILYKRNQSIQTIHMLAPKCATYNGRSTFANPKYLKKAQSNKPCLYQIPYDTSDPANRFAPDGEEIVTLTEESRSKLDKDTVKAYNYTYQNSLYETFKPPSKAHLDQLERAKEIRKTMWRKTFVRTKPNIAKNIGFLPMSNIPFLEREQYHEIQDLKAQMQDKNMVINELKKLILVTKGKSVKTQFDKPSVVRQPNAQRIPKPSVLGKPTPFSNSPEMRSLQTKWSVNKTNVSDGLFKPVTQQNLPKDRNQAIRNTNVLKPGMFRIASTTTQTRTPQLPHASRNTNPHMSKSSGVIHSTSVSRPQLKSYQVKEKVFVAITFVSEVYKEGIQTPELRDVNATFCAECGKISCPVPQCSKRRLITSDHAQVFMEMSLFTSDSGLVFFIKWTSDHTVQKLGIQDHNNEQSTFKVVPKVCFKQNKFTKGVIKSPTQYIVIFARTFRVILFSIHNDEWKSFQCHHQTALRTSANSDLKFQTNAKVHSTVVKQHKIAKMAKTDKDNVEGFNVKIQSMKEQVLQQNNEDKTFMTQTDKN
ncbi:retrovirus-related pol polyprotein from transposon TNT 1-94 [Tanacetum coccineum]